MGVSMLKKSPFRPEKFRGSNDNCLHAALVPRAALIH
jgi:hypothetical protein